MLVGLAALYFPVFGGEVVYKCVEGGKVNFTQAPTGDHCQPLELNVIQPNPDEAARQREYIRLHDKEKETAARDKGGKHKDAEALQRERSAEQAMRLLREPSPFGRKRLKRRRANGYFYER